MSVHCTRWPAVQRAGGNDTMTSGFCIPRASGMRDSEMNSSRGPARAAFGGCPFFGALLSLRRAPLALLCEAAQRGEVVYLGRYPTPVYLLSHPAHLKYVLQDHAENYVKHPSVDRVRPLFGYGLTTSDGELWQRQHRLLAGVFHPQCIAALTPLITERVTRKLAHWESTRTATIDVQEEMRDLSSSIIVAIIFGADAAVCLAVIRRNLDAAIECLNHLLWSFLPAGVTFATPRHWRLRRAIGALDAIVHAQIDAHRRAEHDSHSLLSRLIALRNEDDGAVMSDTQLRDELLTLIAAGYSTVAAALAWTWILLGAHPQAQERLHEEARGLSTESLGPAFDPRTLPYARQVIEESMRLYPPTWVTARTPLERDRIGDVAVPAGSVLLLSPHVMHHHPRYWKEPERFEPDRFLPARVEARPRYVYLPFGGGPRLCLGQGLAMREMVLAVALTARRFRLIPTSLQPPQPRPGLTLAPSAGALFTLQRRQP